MPSKTPFVLGITGGIASGKSTVVAYLKQKGAAVVDADRVARAVVEPGQPACEALKEAFGDAYFTQEGALDRKKLGARVFSDADARARLDALLRPYLFEEIARRLARARVSGKKLVVLDVPLMFESGADALCDEVWCVDAPPELRVTRLAARDGLSPEEAQGRLAAQMDDDARRLHSHAVVDNAGSREDAFSAVDRLLIERRIAL